MGSARCEEKRHFEGVYENYIAEHVFSQTSREPRKESQKEYCTSKRRFMFWGSMFLWQKDMEGKSRKCERPLSLKP